MNISTKWTLVAEARQYCESLAIAEEIATDTQKQLERHQLEAGPVMVEADEEVEI